MTWKPTDEMLDVAEQAFGDVHDMDVEWKEYCEAIIIAVQPLIAAQAVRDFAKAILHGDEVHRAWLTEAAEAYATNQPMLPVRSNPQPSAAEARAKALEDAAKLVDDEWGSFGHAVACRIRALIKPSEDSHDT